jgi:hypothetical protein
MISSSRCKNPSPGLRPLPIGSARPPLQAIRAEENLEIRPQKSADIAQSSKPALQTEPYPRQLHFLGMAKNRSQIPGYLLIQCLFGSLASLAVVALFLATDTAGIGTLIAASPERWTTLVIFIVGSLTTIVPLVVATAIGLLAWRDGRSETPRTVDRHQPQAALRPAPAKARRQR